MRNLHDVCLGVWYAGSVPKSDKISTTFANLTAFTHTRQYLQAIYLDHYISRNVLRLSLRCLGPPGNRSPNNQPILTILIGTSCSSHNWSETCWFSTLAEGFCTSWAAVYREVSGWLSLSLLLWQSVVLFVPKWIPLVLSPRCFRLWDSLHQIIDRFEEGGYCVAKARYGIKPSRRRLWARILSVSTFI